MSDSMVKSADGYEYVTGADVDDEHQHGDLDRIQIDGNIMPVRGDNAVRGEDIAFLTEFANQRRFAVTGGSMISSGKEKTFKAFPEDFSTKGASSFSRKLTSSELWSPYLEFLDLADLSKTIGTPSILFFSATPTATFVHTPGAGEMFDHYEFVELIAEKYSGKSFDASSLRTIGSGDPVQKKIVMDYFDNAEKIKDNGVGLMNMFSADSVSFASSSSTDESILKYQHSVGTWTSSSEPEGYDVIPGWGVYENDFDTNLSFPMFSNYHGHGFPPAGCSMITVDAIHGDKAVALCAFSLYSYTSDNSLFDRAVLLRPYSMAKEGSHTFVLRSDAFASASAVDEIVTASGISSPNDGSSDWSTYHYKKIIIMLRVFPVVYFDGHTNWSANE